MASTLIIENGSIVTGANSYVTLVEVRAYALARALTVPIPDAELDAACVKAADYLETFRGDYKGSKVSPADQSLQWPRVGVQFEGYCVPETEIPKLLKDAQCQLAIETANGLDLMPTTDGKQVLREKVDVVEIEYSNASSSQPSLSRAYNMIAPLLESGGSFGSFTVGRG